MRYTIVFVIALAIASATAWSQSGGGGTPTTATASEPPAQEPITGTAVMPFKGSERPMRDPFSPYDPGGGDIALWPESTLTEAERVIVDRGKTNDFSAVNDAFAAASRERSVQARSDAAAAQLGASELATTGVVP